MVRKIIVGVVTASAITFGLSFPAFADNGCYTGCAPGPVSIVGHGPSTAPSGPSPHESVSPPGGLPVTGRDIEQSVGLAAVLLVAGVAVVRIGRRRSRATS